MKVKVRLKAAIDQPGQGFLDPAGQKIRAAHPKPGEAFRKGQIFEVEKTDFVIERLGTGELIVVEEESKLSQKERKAIFKDAAAKFDEARTRFKKEKVPAEFQPRVDEVIGMIEKAIKEESIDLLREADEKFQALGEALGKK